MNKEMYAVLAESECGLDAFGNPKGKPILFESVGDQLDYSNAVDRASKMQSSGNHGRVLICRIEVIDCQIS